MINAIGIENEYGFNKYSNLSKIPKVENDKSIFLEKELEEIESKQGILGQTWNGIKELTTLGTSASDCESVIEKYKKGEVSFEEAVEYLDEFNSKQENMSGLLSNILTGAGSIAAATLAVVGGPISWTAAFATGAPIGALLKTTINFIDRATNDIEDDAFNAKQMTKDAISGAITGAASAVSSASSIAYKGLLKNGTVKAGSVLGDVAKGALCGVECGAMSASASYLTDVAFGDKDFSFGELTSQALTSAAVSGVVGGAVGATTHTLDVHNLAQALTSKAKIIKDTVLSSSRKIMGTETKETLGLI